MKRLIVSEGILGNFPWLPSSSGPVANSASAPPTVRLPVFTWIRVVKLPPGTGHVDGRRGHS